MPAKKHSSKFSKSASKKTRHSPIMPSALMWGFYHLFLPAIFLSIAVGLSMALLSYSAGDPSWNSSGDGTPIKNLLGIIGAHIADWMWQIFGWASFTLVLLCVLWSIAWMRHEDNDREFYASTLVGQGVFITITSLSSMFLMSAMISFLSDQKLPSGWVGGSIIAYIHNNLSEPWPWLAIVILGVIMLLLLLSAARLPLTFYVATIALCGKIIIGLSSFLKIITLFTFAQFMQLGRKDSRQKVKPIGGVSKAHLGPEMIAPKDKKRFSFSFQKNKKEATLAANNAQTLQGNSTSPSKIEPSMQVGDSSLKVPRVSASHAESDFEDDIPPLPDNWAPSPENLSTDIPLQPEATTPAPSGPQKHTVRHGNSHDDFNLPNTTLLKDPAPEVVSAEVNEESLQQNARRLEEVLADFNISGTIERIRPGPVVTMYELEPAPGIKTTRIINLAEDIARNMRALSVRISTIPGQSTLGIELPNEKRKMVNMKELLSSSSYQDNTAKLPMILGKKIDGTPLTVDLATMPHLLIAGTTGSGKSVGLNVMLLSILYRLTPDECRIIMIDPKMLEFSVYDGIPHLLTPVVTEPKQAVVALKWTVREMENRYRLMSKVGVRNIDGYNARVHEALARGETLERKVHSGFDPETKEAIYEREEIPCEPFPLIVVVVDEMADLMIVAGKEIEASIQRLAQMARAAGIHLIMATQRPSVDVITGTIKANFPTRISYRVTSKIDSRTIIGEQGAEQLLGKGDLLLMQAAGNITRVHAPFVEDAEVEGICNYLRAQRPPSYLEEVTDEDAVNQDLGDVATALFDSDDPNESMYDKAVAIVAHHQKASTSFVQRQLRIGYNRAADLIDEMEKQGVISAPSHAGKREVLIRSFEE